MEKINQICKKKAVRIGAYLLLFLAICGAVFSLQKILCCADRSGKGMSCLWEREIESFEETNAYWDAVFAQMREITEYYQAKQLFDTGKGINKKQVVDLKTFAIDRNIEEESTGISFYLGDLLRAAGDYYHGGSDMWKDIWVEEADDHYVYHKTQIENGWPLAIPKLDLEPLEGDWVKVFNEDQQLNGSMSDYIDYLNETLNALYQYQLLIEQKDYEHQESNLYYYLYHWDSKQAYTNVKEYQNKNPQEVFRMMKEQPGYVRYDMGQMVESSEGCTGMEAYERPAAMEQWNMGFYVDQSYAKKDSFATMAEEYKIYKETVSLYVPVFWSCVLMIFLLLFVITVAEVRRIKTKTLWENSVTKRCMQQFYRIFCGGKDALGRTDTRRKMVIYLLLYSFFSYLIVDLARSYRDFLLGCIIWGSGLFLLYRMYEGARRREKEMALLRSQVESSMKEAMEEKIKSERMKTELITNVSHDIKTPLTSIINYIDLLKRELQKEQPKQETVEDYFAVLEQKSQRLKVLTEDIVEASKIHSGNIVLENVSLDMKELLLQVESEYTERLDGRNLSVVRSFPKETVMIFGDGRKLWRVFGNLFQNIAKYAMPGTRVYVNLEKEDAGIQITMKNISADTLNISSEELLERFVRGDGARTTEGSGLGLSIAKSLVDAMGGRMDLYLDGDLFKVTVQLPENKD